MKYIIPLLFLCLSACADPFQKLESPAETATGRWACEDLQSSLFDVAYAALIEIKSEPQVEDFVQAFSQALKNKKQKVDQVEFLKFIEEFYRIVLSQKHHDVPSLLEKMAAADLGSQGDPEAAKVQKDLREIKGRWSELVKKSGGECPAAASPPSTERPLDNKKNSVAYGAVKTLGVAYQSCEAIRKAPITLQTPNTQGIVIVGTHPDGVGRRRMIGDLPAFLRTEYYLQGFQPGNNCKDVRRSPLIYDYGGKPSTPADGKSLDLFTDAGGGTSVLGVDCSGYVFTAIAAAGLKLDPNKKLKSVLVHGISAALYKNPSENGMPCLEKASMGVSGTLLKGDIVAKVGHVFVIESVGTDPLGIEKARTFEQCDKITSESFNFIIAQSSPSKEGIGINKFVAKDYLLEATPFKAGLEYYARQSCRAKLQNFNIQISGQDIQVVRHRQTSACIDQPLQIAGEACLSGCSAL